MYNHALAEALRSGDIKQIEAVPGISEVTFQHFSDFPWHYYTIQFKLDGVLHTGEFDRHGSGDVYEALTDEHVSTSLGPLIFKNSP